jgi:AcrR family transcriptional regulator
MSETAVGREGGRPDKDAPVGARDRLIAAAIEAFAAKGFHGTSTRDIAAAAGMSPAALYVHYRSKEELLYLICRLGHERTLRLVRDSVATSEDPVERLLAVVRVFTVCCCCAHAISPRKLILITKNIPLKEAIPPLILTFSPLLQIQDIHQSRGMGDLNSRNNL